MSSINALDDNTKHSPQVPKRNGARFVVAFFVLLFLSSVFPGQQSAFGQSFNYTDFSSTAGLQLNGNATTTTIFPPIKLRLTDNSAAAGDNQTSSVYYNTLVNVYGGFTTTFQFQVSSVHNPGPPNGGGEGITFIIQNSPSGITALGVGGGDLGYGTIPKSIAVELDMALTPAYDNNGNHISVHTLGTNPNSADELTASIAAVSFPTVLKDGAIHTVKINFDGAVGWDVYLDDLTTPRVSFNYAIGQATTSARAYVGFTSATGTGNNVETHDILSWSFSSNNPTAGNGVVSGRISDPNGMPIAGAVVNLSGTQERKFITDANGYYRFENVETNGFYTVKPTSANYSFSPAERSFSQIGNSTEAVFTGTAAGEARNALDTPEYFVRQHYLDFLGREPDEAGFNFWSDQIIECGADAACAEQRGINVSAAYFLSIEFQETGGLVDGLYRASYGRAPRYVEFMPDSGAVAAGVVVGKSDWAQKLTANKQAFIDGWVARSDFRAEYDGLGNAAYVDELIAHAGGFNGDRNALVSGLNANELSRAGALRQIAENDGFVEAKRNASFVMMEYFGYLRRDPDEAGYNFWLQKLNQHNGNFEQAEMVKAFIVSTEYRDRFR